ncbi:MAG TPA: MBL fold metallo-hydrolase [Tepidisphaeraceae bacterium]|jgi:glyoxylase-like metal-dependent hydrolase (beta-lactamase superfamily II)
MIDLMQILMNSGGIAMTNCFVIADEDAKVAVMFDAPDHTAGELLDEVQRRGWNLIGLWLTHGHFDHIADHQVVTSHFPEAKVLIHRLDENKLKQPNSSVFELPFQIPARAADAYVDDGQKLSIGNLQAEVMHTPGHSPGHVMYHFAQQNVLVGGDLIIGGSVGRTDLPDSNHSQLEASIRRVMKLPDETRLLPGHGRPATLGHERQTNPYVQMAIEADQ